MTDLRILPVTLKDVGPLHSVTVRDDQDRFVAPNTFTIAQARFETGAYDFCIWVGDTRVGLLALIDMAEHEDREEGLDSPEAVYVWRLLIGAEFQGKGYGRAAVEFAEDWGRERGRRLCQIQAVESNTDAIAMYQACGYALTGKMSDGEVQLEKVL